MENKIKAIETEYNGYRFRSRLEARWAVFFDAAGIKYEYEPEGYVLEDGTRYLPDFFLPDFNVHAEIKPFREADDGKAEKFGLSPVTAGVLICYGLPSDHDLRFVTMYECDESGGDDYDTDWGDHGNVWFARYLDDDMPCIYVKDTKSERIFFQTTDVGCDYEMRGIVYTDGAFVSAENAAKSARFEHGEIPITRK